MHPAVPQSNHEIVLTQLLPTTKSPIINTSIKKLPAQNIDLYGIQPLDEPNPCFKCSKCNRNVLCKVQEEHTSTANHDASIESDIDHLKQSDAMNRSLVHRHQPKSLGPTFNH